jgi:hypothetical protein
MHIIRYHFYLSSFFPPFTRIYLGLLFIFFKYYIIRLKNEGIGPGRMKLSTSALYRMAARLQGTPGGSGFSLFTEPGSLEAGTRGKDSKKAVNDLNERRF